MTAVKDNVKKARSYLRVINAFRECDDDVQQMIYQMASIINDEDASKNEQALAAETIWDALFPDGAVDLEDEELDEEVESLLDREEERFSIRVRELLKSKGMTQDELAQKIGVQQSAISMMLNRLCRPQQRTVERIAKALDVPCAELR